MSAFKKVLGFAVGALAIIGALLLLYLYRLRQAVNAVTATPTGSQVATTTTVAPSIDQQQVTMPAPCVAAALPVAQSCDGIVYAPQSGRNDLFPGSYVNFGLYNTGCYGDVRNRRC